MFGLEEAKRVMFRYGSLSGLRTACPGSCSRDYCSRKIINRIAEKCRGAKIEREMYRITSDKFEKGWRKSARTA